MLKLDQSTDFVSRPWSAIEPFYRDLESQTLTEESIDRFLLDWSSVGERIDETQRRLEIATTRDTADEQAASQYHAFLEDVQPRVREAEQRLRSKLLASGLEPAGFDVQLRKMRAEVDLFRANNLPLLTEESKFVESYHRVRGAQTVEWEGKDVPLARLSPLLEEHDRDLRERAWRLSRARFQQDIEAIDDLWKKLLDVRCRIAANAGKSSYRDYVWKNLQRFDYTPEDCLRFHRAVEDVAVPAARRSLERRRTRMGLEQLRPWDIAVDPVGAPPLRPYVKIGELQATTAQVFHRVDPTLGGYFDTMIREGLLDLETRKNKAQVGYCLPLNAVRLPFIFLNTVGIHDDVVGLLHEGGHAFHTFEMRNLPYAPQRDLETVGTEFAEVGSTAMEFLALPYLSTDEGGFYNSSDAKRATATYLDELIHLWCKIALVDAFQHWIYQNSSQAADPRSCDMQYVELCERFLPGVDWSGLEAERRSDWRRVPHIFEMPFYYIEYGLAQLGAAQIWANARRDQAEAVRRYRDALKLGDTRSVSELFEIAGARLAFDTETLRETVTLIEETIAASQSTG